ncbi:MAG: glycosyltransferase 87 family protein, partial [Ignavibacteria bacterium]|nr:glycosyltransferase 87 family protein [Ignavibacteria bacterium]
MNALQTKNHRLFRPVTLRRLLQAAALLAVGMFVVYSIRWSPRVTHGFAMYYTYSRMVLEGIDFHTAYDYDSFNARIEEFGMAGTRDMPNNLPTNALTFLGIAWLPPGMARIVWLAASLLLLGASVRILFSLYGLTPHETLGLVSIILVCTWRPNYDCIALGQLYILLLFFFSLSLWGVRGA